MDEVASPRPWGRIALVTLPAIVFAGSAIGWLSNSGYKNGWFDNLVEPVYMPPGWLFGVVWPILYALLGIALAMILAEPPSDRRRNALILFFAQLALNFSWSPIFFAGHDITLAKYVIMAMALIAAGAAGQFYRLRKPAGLLMLPYLAWLIFATVLNSAFESLNPGAGTPLFG
jgi:tryptophan-rich sensory protein